MKKYMKKPVVIEAKQWFRYGDHESVTFLAPPFDGPKRDDWWELCKKCAEPLASHGWVPTLEGGHIVCPGDWIIKGIQGEFYPCKPGIFKKTYEEVEE